MIKLCLASQCNSGYTNQQLDALALACYELLYQYLVCYWVYSPKKSPPLAGLVSSEYHCGPTQTGYYLHEKQTLFRKRFHSILLHYNNELLVSVVDDCRTRQTWPRHEVQKRDHIISLRSSFIIIYKCRHIALSILPKPWCLQDGVIHLLG